jgi:hypothetical protein
MNNDLIICLGSLKENWLSYVQSHDLICYLTNRQKIIEFLNSLKDSERMCYVKQTQTYNIL